MLMTGVQQAQRALRLIATRLSAAGQRLLPHTVIKQHWQTGRENTLWWRTGQLRATPTAADTMPKDTCITNSWQACLNKVFGYNLCGLQSSKKRTQSTSIFFKNNFWREMSPVNYNYIILLKVAASRKVKVSYGWRRVGSSRLIQWMVGVMAIIWQIHK